MKIEQRIAAFSKLGEKITEVVNGADIQPLRAAISTSVVANGWFIEDFIIKALKAIAHNLEENKLKDLVSRYDLSSSSKHVGVIMPGNIPAAGFFDAMYVLLSGHTLLAKTSSDDKYLVKALLDTLIAIEPAFADKITYGDFRAVKPDAVIATGSNNTSRYFAL
jgi:hypothetical protein